MVVTASDDYQTVISWGEIDPNLGAMPSMTLEHVERIGSHSATHDSVKLTPAQLAILDSPGLAAR